MLVDIWAEERELAALMESDLSGEAWVAVQEETFAEFGLPVPPAR